MYCITNNSKSSLSSSLLPLSSSSSSSNVILIMLNFLPFSWIFNDTQIEIRFPQRKEKPSKMCLVAKVWLQRLFSRGIQIVSRRHGFESCQSLIFFSGSFSAFSNTVDHLWGYTPIIQVESYLTDCKLWFFQPSTIDRC